MSTTRDYTWTWKMNRKKNVQIRPTIGERKSKIHYTKVWEPYAMLSATDETERCLIEFKQLSTQYDIVLHTRRRVAEFFSVNFIWNGIALFGLVSWASSIRQLRNLVYYNFFNLIFYHLDSDSIIFWRNAQRTHNGGIHKRRIHLHDLYSHFGPHHTAGEYGVHKRP